MNFKNICNDLDKYCNKCKKEKNKVMCAKKFILYNYPEKNDWLRLKAEAMDNDYGYGFSLILAEAGIAFSVFGILFSIVSALDQTINKNKTVSYAIIIIFFLVIVGIMIWSFAQRFSKIKKWKSYILVAIDELLNA